MNEDNKLIFTHPILETFSHPIYGHHHLPMPKESAAEIDLLTAALDGNLTAVESFIKNGDLDAEDDDGYTALHNAVSRKHHNVAKLLIPLVDVNKQSRSGFTPLMNASAYGDNKIISMLLEAGADVSTRNIYGETAYDVAAMGNITIMIFLAEFSSSCELIQKAETAWIRSHYARESSMHFLLIS